MSRTSVWLIAVLLVAGPSAATTFNAALDVQQGTDNGFGFSWVHDGDKSCTALGGITFCMNGTTKDAIPTSQTLTGTFDDVTELLTLDSGQTLTVTGATDIDITGGSIDLGELGDNPGTQTDVFVGTITTSSHGTFHFLDHIFAGPANSWDSGTGTLSLWGNNWSNAGTPDPGPFARYGIDLRLAAGFTPVPEPGAAWLLVLAGLTLLRTRRSA